MAMQRFPVATSLLASILLVVAVFIASGPVIPVVAEAQEASEKKISKLRKHLRKLLPVVAEVKGIHIAYDDLVGHLVAVTGARKNATGNIQHATSYKLFNRDNLVPKAMGQAAVAYNKGVRIPRLDDEKSLVKSLIIGNDRGGHLKGCRYISFKLRVRATHKKNKLSKPVLVGDEAADFVILEDPEDGTLWLLMDWDTYRKNHGRVASLVKKKEDSEGGDKKGDGKPPQRENPNFATLTRLESVELGTKGITIRYHRAWKRRGNAMMEGTFEVKFNSTLDASLYYQLGAKKRLRVAYFHKGFSPRRPK